MQLKSLCILIFFKSILLSSCLSTQQSRLQHKDKPEERGANAEEPWHFHTGQGIRIEEFEDERTGKVIKSSSGCDVYAKDAAEIGCQERVYFFSRKDIEQFVDLTRALMDEQRQKHGANATASASLAGATLIGSGALTIAPEPVATKTGAAIGVLISFGFLSYTAYEYDQLVNISQNLMKISMLLESEDQFVQRCGHLRRDFLENMQKLGVNFQFPENGGQLISAQDFQNSFNEEKKLFGATMEKAVQEKIPSHVAYQKYFRDECGQLPMVDSYDEISRFADPTNPLPENIKRLGFEIQSYLKLLSKKGINLNAFTASDLYSDAQKSSIYSYLVDLKFRLEGVTEGTQKDIEKGLEKFRISYDEIIILPKNRGWGIYEKPKANIFVKHSENKKYLIIEALRSGSFYAAYEIPRIDFTKNYSEL